MEATALQITWFILFGVLIGGYAILDGFDLGVGINSLFVKKSDDRRLMINAIAPVWDGNEVWLVTGGGALFAAFPPVYATTFSGFYLAIMLLLLAMIARAVSMEFRGKVDSAVWKRIWDLSFGLGSLVTTLLFGVAIGNVLRGIPLNANGDFTGTFLDLLNPISIATGILSVVMFSTQGALYMLFKSEGTLHDQMNRIAWRMWLVWGVLFIGVSAATLGTYAHISENALSHSYGWLACVAVFAGLVAMPIFLKKHAPIRAFVASSIAIFASVALVGAGLYPRFVPAATDLAHSLTVANASSSESTLKTMLVIALLGMPLVIAYTIFTYRVFRGKVRIDEHSY